MAVVDRGLWQRIVQHVISAGGNLIRPWFTDLEPVSLEHGLLEIQVPGPVEQTYCRQHATRLFTEAAQCATGRLVGVCFLTAAETDHHDDDGQYLPQEQASEDLSYLNNENTFTTFVSGPCNRLPHAACLAVSEAPGRSYNPLFIHGNAGLGKTHLLQATCHKIAHDMPATSICYLSCESFVNHFIEAVERGKLHEFRYRYRHADVLVIDDIQFLSGHEQTQEEFFHTFNTLYQSQRQIILSSDRGPGEMSDLEERLVSRFNWGLVARMDRPCYETRVAIVKSKARLRSISLPEDVVCFIAGAIDTNARELEGAISKIAMLAKVSDRAMDLDLAREAMGTEPAGTSREVTIEDILNAVISRYGVRLSDLQSKKRSRSITFPRQVCMFLARNLTNHSLEEIGGYFGGRDHTTVLYANKTIDKLRQDDPQFQATLELLSQQIRATS
jgi:chromosomal replication initiator protein